MKRVLVASDLTPRSVGALERGLILAKQIGGAVHVLHVVDANLPKDEAENRRTEGARQLQELLAASPHAAGVSAQVEGVIGHRIDSVLAAVEASNAELVVLGKQRRSPLKDAFVGGTMEQLIRRSKRPVLIAPTPPAAPYQRMLAAVDFSDCSRQAVDYALALLPQVPIELLHVYSMSYTGTASLTQSLSDEEEIERHVHNMVADEEKRFLTSLKASGAPQHVNLRIGNALAVIPEEVTRRNADLLVIGTHGRRGLARAVLGSVAAQLARDPACDVLVVR